MSNLKRQLGLFDVFSVAAGAMISSGLFILPGLGYAYSGASVILAYLLAGILVLPSMLSKAELATAMPKSGGDYFFINRSMGAGFGTLAGISAWFSLAFKSAFALVGIGAFTALIYPGITPFHIKMIAILFCVIFTIVNLKGTKHAGKLQSGMVLGLIILLTWYIVKGIPLVDNQNFNLFMKGDLKTLFMTSGMIFVSYGGLTKIASVAEEVKNPNRNIPIGMISAFTIVTIAYVLVVFVTVGVLGEKLGINSKSFSLTPISDGARVITGNVGMILLSIAALLAFFSTANAGIMAASRNPMAMSKDRLLPSFFGKVSGKHHTPVNSILTTSFFMILVIFLPLETLVKTASTMMLLLFIFANIAVIIMRESGIQNYQPKFKSPLYPWVQIFAIIAYIFLIVEMGKTPLIITSGFMLLGLTWYWFYGRIRANKESALLQLVRRIKSSELVTTSLDSELREIIQERDEIQKDRFDKVIENSLVLDLEGKYSKEDFFKIIAEKLCAKIGESCDNLVSSFMDREAESTTVLSSHLAIPHVILDGENKFDILLARCKEGINFGEESTDVKIIFVIIGSRDQRTFHLRALAAIAQIVQDLNFEKKWLKAKSTEALRDIILLGQRRRNL